MKTIRMFNWIAVLAALFALASPQTVSAQTVFASDCSFGFKNVYLDNEPVCAVIQAGGSLLGGPGLACVVPPGGNPGDDVTPGGCNGVGILLEEPFLWLPPTIPGNYTILVVNNQGGVASDNIVIQSSGGAAPTVNVAAIKAAAGASAGPWQVLADWGEYLDEFASVISIAWAVGTGDWLSAAVGAVGLITGQPTDYNGAVLAQGGQIISALAGTQAARYQSLADDPPDPVFTELFPLDIGAVNTELAALAPLKPGVPLEYPFSNRTEDPMHLASTALANSMTEEAALVQTLMRTLEKFQGAEAAADDQFTLLQARGLVKYSDMLATQLSNTRQRSLDYKAELAAKGIVNDVFDGAEVAALFNRLETSGLTPAEEQSLRDAGFGDGDIQLIFDRIAAFPAPSGTFSRGGALDAIVAATDGMLAATMDLGSQAQDVVDHFAPLVTEQHPTADAGGPYNGAEGTAVTFDGSASTDPQGQALTYEWDFDLDGAFDDAVGATAANTYGAPVETQVGLRVTDTDGNTDIAYAAVSIADVNGPPQITSFVPASLSPTASNLSPLDFSATATDPDLDNVGFEWALDGAVMSNADAWTYTPGIGETGTRSVRLTVSDLNPLSEDAIETRVVRLIEEVVVPDVVGDAQAAAEAAIIGAGLTVGTVDTASSDTVPAGDVISQDPVGGTIALLGSAVDLVVSLGPADVVVPDVVGLPQAAAEAAIIGAGLTVGTVATANSDTVPAGSVISQNPVAGSTAAPGTGVDLVVSLGPADVVVPDVVGLPQAAAEAAIIGAGLTVGIVTTANDDALPAGSVISQNPVAGSSAAPGTGVDLVVSLGPADVVVPDVVGLPQAAAEAAIIGAGLTVGIVTTANDDALPAGSVISQNPVGGSSAAPGTGVDLVVSLGPADVVVPDVVGLPQAAAEAAIIGAGLTVGTVATANSDTVPAGSVISQNPVAGSLAAPGTGVDLVVSLGPADVVVPDVVGLPQAAAEAAIVGAGLVPSATTANNGTVPAGDVISQAPIGGLLVALGSTVNIVVSDGPAGLPPDTPENLLARAKRSHVNVTWQGSDTATSFRVFRRLDTEIDFSEVGQVVPRVFVDDLPAGTLSAEYFVVAENAFGQSDPSEIVTVAPTSRR